MNNLLFLTKKKALKEFPRGGRDRFTGAPQGSFQEGKDSPRRGRVGRVSCPEIPAIRASADGTLAPAGSHSALLRRSVFRAPGPRTRPAAGRAPEEPHKDLRTWARTEPHLVPQAALARLPLRPEDPQPPRRSRGRRRSPRRLGSAPLGCGELRVGCVAAPHCCVRHAFPSVPGRAATPVLRGCTSPGSGTALLRDGEPHTRAN